MHVGMCTHSISRHLSWVWQGSVKRTQKSKGVLGGNGSAITMEEMEKRAVRVLTLSPSEELIYNKSERTLGLLFSSYLFAGLTTHLLSSLFLVSHLPIFSHLLFLVLFMLLQSFCFLSLPFYSPSFSIFSSLDLSPLFPSVCLYSCLLICFLPFPLSKSSFLSFKPTCPLPESLTYGVLSFHVFLHLCSSGLFSSPLNIFLPVLSCLRLSLNRLSPFVLLSRSLSLLFSSSTSLILSDSQPPPLPSPLSSCSPLHRSVSWRGESLSTRAARPPAFFCCCRYRA